MATCDKWLVSTYYLSMALVERTDRYAPVDTTRENLWITPGRREILLQLSRLRYLRSHSLAKLCGRTINSNFRRELSLLEKHGYIALAHWEKQKTFVGYRSNLIYELTARGVRELRKLGVYTPDPIAPLHPGRAEHSRWFAHSLLICDILASIEIGIRDVGAELIPHRAKTLATPPLDISHGDMRASISLEPDALFGIRHSGVEAYYALEADCDTESDHRTTLSRTSYMRKILQYKALIKSGTHTSHWGIPPSSIMYVLNVTISEDNMRDLMNLQKEIGGDSFSNLFSWHPHFEHRVTPKADGHMFTRPYLRVGHPAFQM